jgi:hypothetical protein
MSVTLFARSTIVLSYLAALAGRGRLDLVTGLLAAAIVIIWTVPLLRDQRRGTAGRPDPSRRL